jgi:glutathione S-transferase
LQRYPANAPNDVDGEAANEKQVLVAPFVIRLLSSSKHGLLPANLPSRLEKETPNFYKWAQVISKNPSVLKIYDEDLVVESSKRVKAKFASKA